MAFNGSRAGQMQASLNRKISITSRNLRRLKKKNKKILVTINKHR